MRLPVDVKLVTAGEWSVSTLSNANAAGEFRLNARRFEGLDVVERASVDGLFFASDEDARFAALDAGVLKVYIPRWRMVAADLAVCTRELVSL